MSIFKIYITRKENSLDEKNFEQFENRNYNFAKVGKEFQLIEK